MEVAPEKIGVPVSLSREKKGAATVSSVHSVSHKDEHTWMHSEENLHYGGESWGMEYMINSWPYEAEGVSSWRKAVDRNVHTCCCLPWLRTPLNLTLFFSCTVLCYKADHLCLINFYMSECSYDLSCLIDCGGEVMPKPAITRGGWQCQ